MEVASTSTAESTLEAKGKVRVAIVKLRSGQNEYDALQWQLDIQRSMLEGKNEHVMLGEVLLANTNVDWSKAEDVIAQAKREVLMLEDDEKAIHRQLEEMKLKSGNSF